MKPTVVLLAAGRGERLWPLTSTRPKPLLPLPRGETLLSRLVKQLKTLARDYLVVIPSGRAGEMIRSTLSRLDIPVRFAVQDKPLGTGHAVQVALENLPPGSDTVLIVYGDLFLSRETIDALAELEPPALVGAKSSEPWNYGVLGVDEKNCLTSIMEKPRDAKPGSLVNTGVYLFNPPELEEALKSIGFSPRGELEFTDAVARLAKDACVKVVESRGVWLDVGRPWDLFTVYRHVFNETISGESIIEGEVSPYASIRGPVYIGPRAVVHDYTVVEGPAWIEGEAGPFARIRPWSFILEEARAGTHTEVKSSILMRGSRAPHLNYVGDSIVGEEANLGAGAVTANLRFDHGTIKVRLKNVLVDTGLEKLGSIIGDYAQIGVNVSLLPGVRVGAYSWVHPGLVVNSDIPDCVYARPGPSGVEFVDISSRVECSILSREKTG